MKDDCTNTQLPSQPAHSVAGTAYGYDGDRIIAEYDGSGTLLRKFIYGPGLDEPICLVEVAENSAVYYYHFDGLGSVVALSDVNSVLVERYTYDVFGRPTIRDANGTEVAASAFANPYLFTGRAYDAETGLYYYRARYYDYATGRFLQSDPIAPFLQIAATKYAKRGESISGTYLSPDSLGEFLESDRISRFLTSDASARFVQAARFGTPVELNLYTYCSNNPIVFVDPYGLWLKGIIGTVIVGVGVDLIYAVAVGTAPAWAIPVGLGVAVVGLGALAWDFFDEDDFIDRTVDKFVQRTKDRDKLMKDEWEKYHGCD